MLGLAIITSASGLLSQNTTLIINELSQGSGTQEYVEFLVVSTQNNSCGRPTLDLRKWIFDDNNGYFKAGSGSGIANGSMRFADNPFWSAVPAGTLILIYNSNDFDHTIIPTNDLSLTDGNCRLVIPSNSNLIEKNSLPDNTNPNYPSAGWTSSGDWSNVAMRNAGDAFQIYSANNTTTPAHSVSYGDNHLQQDIYFPGAASGLVYSFENTLSDNYHLQGNWTSKSITGNQTPGLPNSSNNASYILQQNNNCSTNPNASFRLTATVTQPTTCNQANGSITSTVTGGTAPYSYQWSNNETTSGIANVPSGNYTVVVIDNNGCKDSTQVILSPSAPGPNISLTTQNASCGHNDGAITSLVNGGTPPYLYQWSNNTTQANLSNVSSGNYSLTVTDAAGCSTTQSETISQTSNLNVNVSANPSVLTEDEQTLLEATSNSSGILNYNWIPNESISCDTCQQTNAFPTQSTTYIVTVADQYGCIGQASVWVEVKIKCGDITIPNVFSPNHDGINDQLIIQGKCIDSGNFFILNRWGEKVFETDDLINTPWDGMVGGKEASSGVYYYIMNVQTVDGISSALNGMITLVR